jgi:hypothetical protein
VRLQMWRKEIKEVISKWQRKAEAVECLQLKSVPQRDLADAVVLKIVLPVETL